MFIGESTPDSYGAYDSNTDKPAERDPRLNYPLIEDETPLTETDIDHLLAFKARLKEREATNKKIFAGLLTVGVNTGTYALLRYLILSSGGVTIPIIVFSALLVNGVTQAGLLKNAKIDYKDGQLQFLNMDTLLRGLLGVVCAGGLIFMTAGDWLEFNREGKITYRQQFELWESLNRVEPEARTEANATMSAIIAGCVILGAALTLKKN